MEARRVETAEQFLEDTLGLRAVDPLRTNVLGSVAGGIAGGLPWQGGECFWWVVRDGGEVVGAAMRTPPFSLSLSPMPTDALEVLAGEVLAADPELPGVAGFEATVDGFLAASARRGGPGADAVSRRLPQLLYEAPSVRVPEVEGDFSFATEVDAELLVAWTDAFGVEVDGPHRPAGDRRAMVDAAIAEQRDALWRVDGTAVSLAGHAIPVQTPSGAVTRVGPVYTPPELRRRGYAGAVTGRLTQEILARGSRAILYTDALNPTSNHVYQDLGYELVDRFTHVHFARP